jgi:radical SAM superfamily enzyme YgiQ (UPF0313 family)
VIPPRPSSLREPGAVLFISCYELGHQPLSVASPLALLHDAGYSAAALDLAIGSLDPAAVARARFVAIAVPMHTALRLGARAAERVRSLNTECHVCLYGLYATLNAEALLARGADSIIGGEVEEPLLGLVRSLESGGAAPVPGVRQSGRPAGPWIRKVPFAVPRRDPLPPLDRYARVEEGGATRLAGHTEASRGCLHFCRHCPIPPVYGGRFFAVPRAVVLADIRNQVAAGATHITFGDPDFLNGPGHSLRIVREMHAEFPSLTFDFTAKIEHLLEHGVLLPEMARLGCLFIVSAVESLSDRILVILDKGHTRADVERVLALTRRAGIALRPSLVPFTPWAGLGDYRGLLAFIEREDLVSHLDPIQLVIRLLVPPGSPLLSHPEMIPHLGPLDPDRFTYTWTHPDPGMDRLQADLAALVERSVLDGEDPFVTFDRVAAVVERGLPRRLDPARRDKGRAPRLTEPWFC